ncbi:hypothetical protein [Gloeobacter violaceus]|nr:hypothetical protein [Gloeobacter violaceus]
MSISHLQVLADLRHRSDPDAAERLSLGKALLAIKAQRIYQRLGFARFESFLDSRECPFGHTVCRHAMRLAERTDLHGALELGVGRLTELMRLQPEATTCLLTQGIPAGRLEAVSVRVLRRYILQMQGRSAARISVPVGDESTVCPQQVIERCDGQAREVLLNLLLEQQFGQDLARVQVLLQGRATPVQSGAPLEAFWPDTRRGVPQRWVALTAHLEGLERALGGNPAKAAALLQRLRQPIEAWERAVFYLDLCRRDAGRRDYYVQIHSACAAVEKILAGRDWHFNTDQGYLNAQLARGRQSRPVRLKPFWRRLFNEVAPPQEFQDFLGQLACEVQAGEWCIRCDDSYQADFTLGCLRQRTAKLFWQIAAAHLDVERLRVLWQEGGRPREQVVHLQLSAA